MFEADGDAGLMHPGEDGDAMGSDGYWIVAILALERADRLVLRIRSGRDDVHNRGIIEVDAGRAKFLRPCGGATL